MSRSPAGLLVLLVMVNACRGGTSVLGEQAPQTQSTPSTAGAAGGSTEQADAQADAGPTEPHDHDHDPCRDKHCGQLCGEGSGEGPDGFRFCDRRGDCVSGVPQCQDDLQCTTASDCPDPAATMGIESCFQCSDGSVACNENECVAGGCRLKPAQCSQGVQHCMEDRDCPAGAPELCEPCLDSINCPTSHCVFGQCTLIRSLCDVNWPCRGHQCGHPCTLCDPSDPTCDATASSGICNAFGECVTSGESFCPPPPP